jgi:GNAT superfamily N-acetyltransferase
MTAATAVDVRPYAPGDEPAVLDLLAASMGWVPDDAHARFLAWKHRENPFGTSPAWVAAAGDRVVGFRTFMRWRFVTGSGAGATEVPAVRAVDTATHPDHQGRGIFSLLTRHALAAVAEDGTAFVFNTPNDRSRPGYLKMGWRPVGRLPVRARLRSPAVAVRLARARTPAGKWSEPSDAGLPAAEVAADPALPGLLAAADAAGGLRTARSPAYLAWRYGFAPLSYRALTAGSGAGDGVVVFRLRRRGPALEATVCEELVPGGDRATTAGLLRAVLAATGADYAVRLGGHGPRAGCVPVPRQGPTLVWRAAAADDGSMPQAASWRLSLGDVELM